MGRVEDGYVVAKGRRGARDVTREDTWQKVVSGGSRRCDKRGVALNCQFRTPPLIKGRIAGGVWNPFSAADPGAQILAA
jgi:hypothetical protein